MSNEKNEVFTSITTEEAVKYLADKRNEILESFTKAYLAESGLMPSQVELVTQQMPTENNIIETVYFFRKKA